MFEKRRAMAFINKQLPLKTPEGHEELYYEYIKPMNILEANIEVRSENGIVDAIGHIRATQDNDITCWEYSTAIMRYLDPKCTDLFDFKPVIDYMDRRTNMETLLVFEKAGRSICQEIIDELAKNPKDKRLQDLAGLAIDTGRYRYDQKGEDTEFGRMAFMLMGIPKMEIAKLLHEYKTLDEVPTPYIYRAWEGAVEHKWVNECRLENYMFTREPEDEESKRIYEKWCELNPQDIEREW